MLILSFESSCDETSCAVCRFDGETSTVLSNIVASQISIHALYGGVVPEIASRAHIEAVSNIAYKAIREARVSMAEIDAVAVTNTPGLIGALLVCVSFAKGIAFTYKKPLIAVNHIRGHIAANYYSTPAPKPPFTALVASGGHTSIVNVETYTRINTIGKTRDDAIGEAFDKVARKLNIPYPGGAEMDVLASKGNPNAIPFPLGAIPDDTLDFSFSGLKTAVVNYLHREEQNGNEINRCDVAASFTNSVCKSVIKKLSKALEITGHSRLVLAGGVAANSHLRKALEELSLEKGIALFIPPKALCGDNAAMIAAQAYHEFKAGNTADFNLNAYATKR